MATQVGTVMGTLTFMPPEQARGRWDQVDRRADIFAVGATMFRLLSGRPLHTAPTLLADPMPKPTTLVTQLRVVDDAGANPFTVTEAARTPRVAAAPPPSEPLPQTARAPVASLAEVHNLDEVVEAFVRRGILRGEAGDYAAAIDDFTHAVSLDERCGVAFYNRAIARHATGQLSPSADDYGRALELLPNFADAHYNRSLVRRALGDRLGAAADARDAERLYEALGHDDDARLARAVRASLDG
jgi:tetratricopeptide (TPR) repeat protein